MTDEKLTEQEELAALRSENEAFKTQIKKLIAARVTLNRLLILISGDCHGNEKTCHACRLGQLGNAAKMCIEGGITPEQAFEETQYNVDEARTAVLPTGKYDPHHVVLI